MDELRVSCATTDGTLHFLSAHAGDMVWQETAELGSFLLHNPLASLLDRHFVQSLTLCKLVAGLLVKLEFRGCLRWRQVEVGTSVNFPCDDDFAICHNDSCWNIGVISLSSLVLDHSWEFECRIGIVVCTCVAYYLLLPFCQSSTIYISEAGSCWVFKESLCYKNVPLILQGLCKGHGGIVTVSLPKGMY